MLINILKQKTLTNKIHKPGYNNYRHKKNYNKEVFMKKIIIILLIMTFLITGIIFAINTPIGIQNNSEKNFKITSIL